MEQKPLTASSNIGIGLWTSICVFFCSIFGIESQNYRNKQRAVLARANRDLTMSLKALGPGYTLVDYRVTWSSSLSVTVSALAVKEGKVKQEVTKNSPDVCPKCGSPITEEMFFCGECGQKLK